MRVTAKVAGYEIRDVLRSRWLIGYTLFFLLVTDALFRFGGGGEKALLSLVNLVLFVIPLVAIVFSTVYLYHAREFIELLLTQPIKRRQVFLGLYMGLTLPLCLSFVAAVIIPFVMHRGMGNTQPGTFVALLLAGVALTMVFTALALLIVARTEDRMKGLGIAVALWLFLAVLYDGLVLLLVSILAEYPIEKPVLALMLANPMDLARVALLLQFDVAALLGYTGAVLQKFFGRSIGVTVTSLALAFWVFGPLLAGMRAFQKKDF
ncbi:MAG: ABC transporter permease subunit [Gemmatimonadales bacterium]